VDFYINGADAGFSSNSGFPHDLYGDDLNSYTIGLNTIGGSTTNPTQDGDLSDVSIYDTALTGGQIESLYAGVPDPASPITLLVSAAALTLGGLVLRKRPQQVA
jgi:hypothetical protein